MGAWDEDSEWPTVEDIEDQVYQEDQEEEAYGHRDITYHFVQIKQLCHLFTSAPHNLSHQCSPT
jgi:hypothetical protein